jgi:glycosyltransferase involved in cell wall biosynthesis
VPSDTLGWVLCGWSRRDDDANLRLTVIVKIAIYHNLRSGGAKRALFDYAKSLTENGHTVDVYAPASADEQFLDLRPVVSGYHVVPLRAFSPPVFARSRITSALSQYATSLFGLSRHGRAVARAIDAGGYDVAFVHQCQFAHSPYVLRFLRTPAVYYCQEPRRVSFEYSVRYYTAELGRLQRWVHAAYLTVLEPPVRRGDIRAARAATLILANSFFSVESIKRAYGRYARVAYLGTDLGALGAAQVPRRNAVISVGALEPPKGHELVLEAIATLPATRRPEVHLVADRSFTGHGRSLADRAAALGVTLSIHERISDSELVGLYSTARAAVCAAELEPFGFTPLEAMACGTPVVAVREGGYKETVIDAVNGRLVERDPRQLGLAIGELLADEASWHTLSRGALESASRWSVQAATATLERLLAEVVAAA